MKIKIDHKKLAEDIIKEIGDGLPWSETEWAVGEIRGMQVRIRLIRNWQDDEEPTRRKNVRFREAKP